MMELEQNGTNITETAQGNKHLLTTKAHGEHNFSNFFFLWGNNYRLD